MKQFNRDKLRNKLVQKNEELQQISNAALALLQEENPVQDEEYNKKLTACSAFVEKMEAKTGPELSVEKLILINCYMSLGKHYVNFYGLAPLLNYTKAQYNFLQAYNRSFAALQSDKPDIIFLDNAVAFGKISIYLAYYYEKDKASTHYKKICDVVTAALEYSIKWKKAAHTFALSAILAIAYHGLKDFGKAIKYLDHIKDTDSAQRDYSNILRLELMLAMVCVSKYLNKKGQYKKVFEYCSIILHLSELKPEDCTNYRVADIVNSRIKFECLLVLAIAHIGLADLSASKNAYIAALVTHIFIYQQDLASEIHKKNYPLISMTEKLEKAAKYLEDIHVYAHEKNISLDNMEKLFKDFLYTHIPNLDSEAEEQLRPEVLKQLADGLSEYMTLITAWAASKKFKLQLIQKAATINRLLNNPARVRCYEAMAAELQKNEVKTEVDIIDLISSTKIIDSAAKKAAFKNKTKITAKPLAKKAVINTKPAISLKEDIQRNYHQTILLTAYRFYKRKKFSKAIKLYTKLRHNPNLKRNLIIMQCLSGIGESYSSWAAESEQERAEASIITAYREKARLAYQEALQLMPADISEYRDPDYIEMHRLAEFIYQFINSLQAADLKAVEEEQKIVIKNHAKQPELSTTQPTNQLAHTHAKPLPITLANYLAPSLEKALQQPVKRQVPIISISRSLEVSAAAEEVQSTLQEAGFYTYLVGGAVRDQILGKQPKDYDIVTNAHPEEVTALFPEKSKIVGNHFTLVLVEIEGETFEVATLRQCNLLENSSTAWSKELADNPYGVSLRQDARRRDFTFNALYYKSNTIIDFVGGYQDLMNKLIRTIGKAKKRFSADPILILRALRFAAQLDFALHEDIITNLPVQAALLSRVNLNRLYSEVQHTFLQGFGAKVFTLAFQHKVLQVLFPATSKILTEDEQWQRNIQAILAEIDNYYWQNKQVSTAIFLAIMLWLPLQAAIPKQGVVNSIKSILNNQLKIFQIPVAVANRIKAIWLIHIGNYHSVKINTEVTLEKEDFSRANVFADLLKKTECCENNNIASTGIKLA